MPSFDLGESIPPDTAHAVSVSLPTWRSNVGYEEGERWVVDKMTTGYPRFFVHRSIASFAKDIAEKYGKPGQQAMLFPVPSVAKRCLEFMKPRVSSPAVFSEISIVDLSLDPSQEVSPMLRKLSPTISAVVYPDECQPIAKQYWQHTGDGVSSRRAEFCHDLFRSELLAPTSSPSVRTPPQEPATPRPFKGPRRYQRPGSIDGIKKPPSPPSSAGLNGNGNSINESQESSRFVEERFGRNLDLSLVERAKSAIRRRIAGAVATDLPDQALPAGVDIGPNSRGLHTLRENDVYLFPAGMNAIFNAHRALLAAAGDAPKKSINLGFPYVDTLKILQKFGPGCVFYGNGSDEDLDDLEDRLRTRGERFLGLFCEFPGNPLLKCPDLARIRRLADEFGFAVVVDETIGTFSNINVLPAADIVVSSLTKIFSGASNVMGGSAILNPEGRHYGSLKKAMEDNYEDTYWPEDIVFMERNSRDFLDRVDRINANAEAICDVLRSHPAVKAVYYPKHNPTKPYYDAYRLPNGGYGGLLSVVFHHPPQAVEFYNTMEIAKGPSLGTNFTLGSPYVLLAHYGELSWAAEYGVDPDLVRLSVGLEETSDLEERFRKALAAAENASTGTGSDVPAQ